LPLINFTSKGCITITLLLTDLISPLRFNIVYKLQKQHKPFLKVLPTFAIGLNNRRGAFPKSESGLYACQVVFPKLEGGLYVRRMAFPKVERGLYTRRDVFPKLEDGLYTRQVVLPKLESGLYVRLAALTTFSLEIELF
jgi:hypothetical protein